MEFSDGTCLALAIRPVEDCFLSQQQILDSVPPEPFFSSSLMERHIHPALEHIRTRKPKVGVSSYTLFGSSSGVPRVSVIVPIYKRLDFIEYQLASFANDPQLHAAELVYVVDDPTLQAEVEFYAFHLWQLYRVPFRLVVMSRNAGYSTANNIGVQVSSAPVVLFLNSDVFPKSPGWLECLLDSFASTPRVGAMGCKLLYEDDSLQHAGMYFYRDYHPYGLWINMHYFKGLPTSWPAANEPRAVPGVTGAAMMVARAMVEDLGGWDATYIVGNYEDSDLCLRLINRGLVNHYTPAVELYHLEGQSQQHRTDDTSVQRASDLYNRWLQTHRWNSLIEDVMMRHHRKPSEATTK